MVSASGLSGLDPGARAQLSATIVLDNPAYRAELQTVFDRHPPTAIADDTDMRLAMMDRVRGDTLLVEVLRIDDDRATQKLEFEVTLH